MEGNEYNVTQKSYKKHRNRQKCTDTNRNILKEYGNDKFSYLQFFNTNFSIVLKTQIFGAHEAIPCAPQ